MAPIIVKSFEWYQSYDFVTIKVDITLSKEKLDVFTSSTYLKVHSPPFLFELFLTHEIIETESKCTVGDNFVVFELKKKSNVNWLDVEEKLNNAQKIERKKFITQKKHEECEESNAQHKNKLTTLKRLSVQQQIDLDSQNRKLVEEIKNYEKSIITKEISDGFNDLSILPILNDEHAVIRASHDQYTSDEPLIQQSKLPDTSFVPSAVDDGGDYDATKQVRTPHEDFENTQQGPVFPIPLPRQTASIKVHFSTREFPTPTRESLHEEEQEWLKKQLAARKAAGFIAEDLRPEECNPTWLKDKADTFYKHGNYLGAVSAYSHAIKIGSRMPALFANRSASHLALGNLHKALEDCSQALELLMPRVAANADLRATCHARRAVILCRLGLSHKGLPDFQEALRLCPNDEKLRADYDLAKKMSTEEESDDSD